MKKPRRDVITGIVGLLGCAFFLFYVQKIKMRPLIATIKIIAKISENPFFMSPPYLTILLWQASALPSFSTKQSLKTIVLAMFGSLPSALKRKVLTPVASRLFLQSAPLISQVSRYRLLFSK